jgi:glucokinase
LNDAVLIADIGGTNVRFALFGRNGPLSSTMEPVPTVAVTHELAGLVGAAAIAANRV